ncbi:phosphopantetheine-binding protein [Vibrio sp. PP-XX7]
MIWVAELPDGTIEYMGRNDDQVKIAPDSGLNWAKSKRRCGCVGVDQAIVIAQEIGLQGKSLVAYYTQKPDADISIHVLKSQLSACLPDYMVPTAYVMLDTIPLTPNGKVDRKGLPEPSQHSIRTSCIRSPGRRTETILAEIWQQLLGQARISRTDNFFELGGHSLLAIQLISRIHSELNLSVTIADLFLYPCFKDFSERLLDIELEQFDHSELSDVAEVLEGHEYE